LDIEAQEWNKVAKFGKEAAQALSQKLRIAESDQESERIIHLLIKIKKTCRTLLG
jgi:hypothetical protein